MSTLKVQTDILPEVTFLIDSVMVFPSGRIAAIVKPEKEDVICEPETLYKLSTNGVQVLIDLGAIMSIPGRVIGMILDDGRLKQFVTIVEHPEGRTFYDLWMSNDRQVACDF
jgi:hypothetical protein